MCYCVCAFGAQTMAIQQFILCGVLLLLFWNQKNQFSSLFFYSINKIILHCNRLDGDGDWACSQGCRLVREPISHAHIAFNRNKSFEIVSHMWWNFFLNSILNSFFLYRSSTPHYFIHAVFLAKARKSMKICAAMQKSILVLAWHVHAKSFLLSL